MSYDDLELKEPVESDDYEECSSFVVRSIERIIEDTLDSGQNKIVINTNLRLSIPMENVNKIAGPFIEAWALEKFSDALEDKNSSYHLINVEAGKRLNMADEVGPNVWTTEWEK